MHRFPETILLLLTLLIFTIISCSSKPTYTIEQKDGYHIVHNLAPLYEKSPISIEFAHQWGTEDPADQGVLFGEPAGVAVDNEKNLYILDRSSNEIIKINPSGEIILRFGKKGQGPGEFMYPYGLQLINNTLYIADFVLGVQTFTLDGHYKGRIENPSRLSMISMLDSATIILKLSGREAPNNGDKLINLYNINGRKVSSFCEFTPQADPGAAASYNHLHIVPDRKGNFIVAFIARKRFEKYDNTGKLLFTIDRQTPIKEYIRDAGKDPDYGYTNWETSHFTRSLQVDHKNRIWLISFKEEPDPEKDYHISDLPAFFVFEVFDEDGIHLCSLDFPAESFDTFRIIGDRMFFVDPKEKGVVREYKIVDT